MATEAPIKYTDPLYASLDERVTQKLGLPSGLLEGIRTKGERSNADQVSEAGARTVYQIIPSTRKAVLDKYGIDAYLSPENAAEAAGLLLKESLARNKGDQATAIAEYHGGTDRANWGPRTKNYVARVTGGQQEAAQPAAQAPTQSIIARAYEAYRSGRMSPEDAAEFEADVNAGTVNLPLGASLIRRAEPSFAVPQSVVDAYKAGKMTPQDAAEFEADMRANPQLVPAGLTIKPFRAEIPGQTEGAPSDVSRAVPEPTLGEQVIGAGETALALGTGAIGGPVGAVKGFVGGLVDPSVTSIRQLEQATQQGAESFTFAPRTAAGQAQTSALGKAAQNLIPIAPLAPQIAGLQRAGQAARPTAQVLQQTVPQVARETAATAAQNVAAGARAIPERVGQMVGREPAPVARPASGVGQPMTWRNADTDIPVTFKGVEPQPGSDGRTYARVEVNGRESFVPFDELVGAQPTPGTMGSAGAAATDIATQRQALGQSLPIPIEQSLGQLTREPGQMRFESEVAKQSGKPGETLRDFTAEQNQRVARNFDALIDQTEAQKTNMLETGRAVVDEGLKKLADRSKAEYNVKFRKAREAGEMEDPTSMEGLANVLNESVAAEGNAPIIAATRKELQRLGGATMDEQGRVVGGELTLNQAEELRKFINKTMNTEGADLNYAPQLRSAIDAATEGLGGELYKEARKAYQRHAQLFKDNAIVKSLLDTKKGTSDRRVALEDVFQKTILNGSREDLSMLRRTLQVGKAQEGLQAWKELQGATLRHLAEEANAYGTVSNATDVRGNPIIQSNRLNNAVSALEEGNKLDFILGKQQAQMVRDLNELTKLVKTAPPGTINTSNTAATILGAIAEAGATGAATGLPLPVISVLRALSKNVKDRKLQAKVNEAIGRQAAANARPRAQVKPIDIKKP